jgi:hypothetical protein
MKLIKLQTLALALALSEDGAALRAACGHEGRGYTEVAVSRSWIHRPTIGSNARAGKARKNVRAK